MACDMSIDYSRASQAATTSPATVVAMTRVVDRLWRASKRARRGSAGRDARRQRHLAAQRLGFGQHDVCGVGRGAQHHDQQPGTQAVAQGLGAEQAQHGHRHQHHGAGRLAGREHAAQDLAEGGPGQGAPGRRPGLGRQHGEECRRHHRTGGHQTADPHDQRHHVEIAQHDHLLIVNRRRQADRAVSDTSRRFPRCRRQDRAATLAGRRIVRAR